jgi:hypothetical protein
MNFITFILRDSAGSSDQNISQTDIVGLKRDVYWTLHLFFGSGEHTQK